MTVVFACTAQINAKAISKKLLKQVFIVFCSTKKKPKESSYTNPVILKHSFKIFSSISDWLTGNFIFVI